MGFLYMLSKFQKNMYWWTRVLPLFVFVQYIDHCAEFWANWDSGQSWTRRANNRCKMRMLQDTNGPENRSKMTASSVYIEWFRNEAAECTIYRDNHALVGRLHDAVKEGEWADSDEYLAEKIAQNVANRCALDLRGEEMSKVLGKGAISPRTSCGTGCSLRIGGYYIHGVALRTRLVKETFRIRV